MQLPVSLPVTSLTVGKLLVVLSHELYIYIYIYTFFYTLCRHPNALLSAGWTQLSFCTFWFFLKNKVSAGGENAVCFVLSISLFYLCSYIYFVLLK